VNDVTQKILIGIVTAIGIAAARHLYLRVDKFYRLKWLPSWTVFTTIGKDVALIKAEVMTNGGGSLKDRVTDMQTSLTVLEARQRGLIAALPRATFETDDEFRWMEGNHAMERLFGLGFTHLSRHGWKSWIHEADRALVMEEIHHAVKDRRGVGTSFRIVTEQGECHVHMEATPTLERPKMDRVLCWTGWIAKVDDRRLDERRTA
jgi:PAS domain S-box-containing protein